MNRKLRVVMAGFLSLLAGVSYAQSYQGSEMEELQQRTEKLEKAVGVLTKFKVSGYIQTQFQAGQKDASLKVGSSNEDKTDSFNRFGIRRGRIKFTYEENIVSGVFQLDITEKGVGFKDAYLNIKDPWLKTSALRAGIFDRPFGYEIGYSSSRRESPERSAVFQTLFPDERDLGAMLILKPAKTSLFHALTFQGGLFAGNGIKMETDSRKDFIGQLRLDNKLSSIGTYGIGVSGYFGGVYQTTANVYEMDGNSYKVNTDSDNLGKYAKRQYFGVDGQLNLKTDIGETKLTAEFLLGQQPGSASSSKSPNYSSLPSGDSAYDMYIRKFNGGYVMLVQDLGRSPLSAVVKYDWYDPNTKVSGNEVGLNGTGKTDLTQNTIGFGLLWNAHKSLRLTAYYEVVNYEDSDNVSSMQDYKGNIFTLRLQYKF